MKLNKFSLLLCCLLPVRFFLPSQVPAADDWRIIIFERYQDLWREYEQEEANFLVNIKPVTKVCFDAEFALREAYRAMLKYVFLKQINNSPEDIDWNNPYNWGVLYSDDAEQLAKRDKNYSKLREKFLTLKKNYRHPKDLTPFRLRKKNMA